MQTYDIDLRPTILLIDGAHALRRSMYVDNLRGLSNSKGMPTGAVYGFLNILKSAVTSMSASSVVVCWEGGHSERRTNLYQDYKKKEYSEEVQKDVNGYTDYEYYCHQLSWIQKILEYLGVHQLSVPGKEGDDVLYRVSHLLGGRKIIISEDKDFYALVSEDISIYRPVKKEYVDLNNFYEVTNGYLSPTHYLYGKVLLGDGSDNIPSVAKGVGETTVLSILKNIEDPNEVTPERILREAAKIGKSRPMKLVEAGESTIIRNLDLIDISREPFDIFQLQSLKSELEEFKYPNLNLVHVLFNALEFNEENSKSLIYKLSTMSEFPLTSLINNDYILSVMRG